MDTQWEEDEPGTALCAQACADRGSLKDATQLKKISISLNPTYPALKIL